MKFGEISNFHILYIEEVEECVMNFIRNRKNLENKIIEKVKD